MQINKIYRMDAADFLRRKVDDASVDLAVIDPPYNLNKAAWDRFTDRDAFLAFTFNWLDLLIPKLKTTGSLYVFNTPFNAAYILRFLVERGLLFQNWIVWDKRDGLSAPKRKYAGGQEAILFFTKSARHVFNYDAVRVPYNSAARMQLAAKKGILKNGKRWYPNAKGKLCTDVWHFSSARHKQKAGGKTQKLPHVTPKPADMIARMITASSNEGDLVLDCFMGSGTVAVACKQLKRNFIGCENNEVYYDLCMKNLAATPVADTPVT